MTSGFNGFQSPSTKPAELTGVCGRLECPRILIAVSIILVFSTALGITWAAVKDDTQTGFTIASFVLGAGSRT